MTSDRRSSTSKRRFYATAASFITFMMVITALGAFDFTSARQVSGPGGQQELTVQDISLETVGDGNRVRGEVIVMARGVRVADADVSVAMLYPDGSVQTFEERTSRAGRAIFNLNARGTGQHSLGVTNIEKSGFWFDVPENEAEADWDSTVVSVDGGEQPTDPTPTPTEEPGEPTDPTPTPTEEPTEPTPTPTEEPGNGDGGHDHSGSMHAWHAPGAHDGLPAHEHGDAPPQWVIDAGYNPGFNHDAMTPNENMVKHTAMKGFAGRMNGVDIYVIAHLDTHPNGQQTRFHSYQYWMKDPSGGVSNVHGWMDFGEGDNALPNIRPVDTCQGQSVRPIIQVNFPECDIVSENWYSRASGSGGHAPDFGFNIQPQYYGGPSQGNLSSGNLDDIDTWLPTGQQNSRRRMELAWYAERGGAPRGEFWTDQWGRHLSGPNDPSVGTTETVGGRTYEVLALRQYIAPSAVSVVFPGNSLQKNYPMAGPFELPN